MTRSKVDRDERFLKCQTVREKLMKPIWLHFRIDGRRSLSVPCRAVPGTTASWYLGCYSVSRVSCTWNSLLRADVRFVARGDATSGLNTFFSSVWGNRSSRNVRGFVHNGVFVATIGWILKKRSSLRKISCRWCRGGSRQPVAVI